MIVSGGGGGGGGEGGEDESGALKFEMSAVVCAQTLEASVNVWHPRSFPTTSHPTL